MKTKNTEMVRMNISLRKDMYDILKDFAERDHLKVTTWSRQVLMREIEQKLKHEEQMPYECPF